MSGLILKNSSLQRFSKHIIGDNKFSSNTSTNPFDSDDELDNKHALKSSGRTSRHRATDAKFSRTNPFDSDDELDTKQTLKHVGKKSSEPSSVSPIRKTNPFDDCEEVKHVTPHQSDHGLPARNRYRNDFRDAVGLENQTVEELESYAVYKAEETTKTVNSCLKIAEDMRESGTKTMVALHQQGEQLTRSHMIAADIDQDLSRGEKLLGSLGGMFSKTWKPKKTHTISGPAITREPIQRKVNHLEQRERLGLISYGSNERQRTRSPPTEPTNTLQKVEMEKLKQDDALLDLSNTLGDLKEMALDMGSEIERQNKGMERFQDDVEELNFRVKGANQRTRRLLGK